MDRCVAVALIWSLHPLQTESVTYVVQRAESLMGMLYLLTLYCAIRGFEGDRATYVFDETAPLSTYLFSFAAGKFQVETAERDGRVMRMYHRETDEESVSRNRDAIFDLHATALSWLEEYTGIP